MLLLFEVGCAGVELGHCKAPDVSQTILHLEFGGSPNPPTHDGTADIWAVPLFPKGLWLLKHRCEIVLVQLFKQQEQNCHAQNTLLGSIRTAVLLTNTSHLAESTGSAAELLWVAKASLWVLPPMNLPDLLGRRWMKVENLPWHWGGHLGELVEPALCGCCVHKSGHSSAHSFWGISLGLQIASPRHRCAGCCRASGLSAVCQRSW